MCSAEWANHCYQPTTTSPTRSASKTTAAGRFAMKLPRYNSQPSSAAAGTLLHGSCDEQHTSPSAVEVGGDKTRRNNSVVHRVPSSSGGHKPTSTSSTVRRCQSANVSSRTTSFIPHLGSHSQEPNRSEELPIPSPSSDQGQSSSARFTNGEGENVDKGDLTRMYDYATWNMYERIVSARRFRLSAIDSIGEEEATTTTACRSFAPNVAATKNSSQTASGGDGATTSGQDSVAVNAVPTVPNPIAKVLKKQASPRSDDSTLATADETDRESTTSSSWSRDGTFPVQVALSSTGLASFPRLDRPASCPPQPSSSGEEDHLIFDLDL